LPARESSSTEETKRVIAALYDAARAADPEAFFACLHEDIEISEPACLPYGGTHRGVGAVKELFAAVSLILDVPSIKVDRIVTEADRAVCFVTAALRDGGATVEIAEEWVVRDGKAWRGRVFYFDPTPVLETVEAKKR